MAAVITSKSSFAGMHVRSNRFLEQAHVCGMEAQVIEAESFHGGRFCGGRKILLSCAEAGLLVLRF